MDECLCTLIETHVWCTFALDIGFNINYRAWFKLNKLTAYSAFFRLLSSPWECSRIILSSMKICDYVLVCQNIPIHIQKPTGKCLYEKNMLYLVLSYTNVCHLYNTITRCLHYWVLWCRTIHTLVLVCKLNNYIIKCVSPLFQ